MYLGESHNEGLVGVAEHLDPSVSLLPGAKL